MSLIKNFIENIEDNIYKQHLIYRSILITNNNIESFILKNELTKKDYNSMVVKSIDETIDYNNIDNRIIILSFDKFINFIDYIDIKSGLSNSSFNFIAFNYTINSETLEALIKFYMNKTNNNINNTIIMEKNYKNYLHLQNK